MPSTSADISAAWQTPTRSRYGLPGAPARVNYMCCSPAIAAHNTASGSIYIDDLPGNRPPRSYSGAVIFCPARKCALMAVCGLLLLGGIGIPHPMQHAVRGVLAWFVAVLWHGVLGGVWLPRFSRLDRGGAGTSGAGGTTVVQIVLTGPAMLWCRGSNPGRDSALSSPGQGGVSQAAARAQSGSFATKVAAKVARFCAEVADSR